MFKTVEKISAYYANPQRFMRLAGKLHAPVWALALIVLAVGLYMVANVPDDYQQGATVRIMFVHVPAAWMSLFAYSFIFFASVTALIFRHPVGHVAGRAAAQASPGRAGLRVARLKVLTTPAAPCSG